MGRNIVDAEYTCKECRYAKNERNFSLLRKSKPRVFRTISPLESFTIFLISFLRTFLEQSNSSLFERHVAPDVDVLRRYYFLIFGCNISAISLILSAFQFSYFKVFVFY